MLGDEQARSTAIEDNLLQIYRESIAPFFESKQPPLYFEGKKGVRIAYAVFRGSDTAPDKQDAVLIVQGRAETIQKYAELIFELTRLGHVVYAYDHRGQGLSDRLLKKPEDYEKGYIDDFNDYVDDLETFRRLIVAKAAHRKVFILSHSMGGAISALWAEKYGKGVDGIALSSPMFEPTVSQYASPLLKHLPKGNRGTVAGWANRFACNVIIPVAATLAPSRLAGQGYDYLANHQFDGNPYTQSRARFALFADMYTSVPQARIGGATWMWVRQACKAGKRAIRDAASIGLPVLVLQGEKDAYVEADSQFAFCKALRGFEGKDCASGDVVVIHGARHEMLIESDAFRIEVLKNILGFFHELASGREPVRDK